MACPTHTSGHTLDLIISRSINEVNITEFESTLALSDHLFIECNLNMLKPKLAVKKVRFHQLKRIDIPCSIKGLNETTHGYIKGIKQSRTI